MPVVQLARRPVGAEEREPDDGVGALGGRYPDDRGLAALVALLQRDSADFAARWATAHVAVHRSSRTTVPTPVSPVAVDCDVLTAPGLDVRIIVYTVVPGSQDAGRLDLRRVTCLRELGPRA